ncbi:MAG: aspartate-semialdehyde dehydrogenase [Dehalococcoidales bacterium]|jgi:aspartate-semialdehyde dehydrogenase|nr:aspartate-semialdehyde dehydrogenase [Dehalococcoidales bacterium]
MEKYRIAVVGATSLIGQEMIRILEERNFPFSSMRFFTSDETASRLIYDWRHEHSVEILGHVAEQEQFKDLDLVFFAENEDSSRHWTPLAVETGATVIDCSPAFRMEPEVPLVIPEVNVEDIRHHRGIIASPDCMVVLLNMILAPLHKINPVKRVVVSTYQSASGLGSMAMNELTLQTQQFLAGESPRPRLFPHSLAFNVLPHMGVFLDSGYTRGEWQLLEETRKILHDNNILVSATCAWVPVFKGDCAALNAEFEKPINSDKVIDLLAKVPGLRVVDDTAVNLYPQPRVVSGMDEILVGRIRQDILNENGIMMWAAIDNIRKGAALNMVQIAEEIHQRGWLKAKGRK